MGPVAPGRASSTGLRRRRWGLAGFAAVNALAAWGGAVALLTGGADFGKSTNDRLPFDSLVVAGLALAAIVAIPLTLLAWSAWTGSARTDDVALIVGLMLIGWIVAQVVLLRAFSLFQPVYLCVGASFVAASNRVALGPRYRGILFAAIGAIVAAAGVGLVPHVIRDGLSFMSALSIVLLVAGIGLVVVGGRSMLRNRRRVTKLVGAVATAIATALAVSIIAPGVAATHVPATDVTSTPAALGLDYEQVTLTTTDGVELAAWYLPGTTGAGVVVMHGAGSTRSDALAQSEVLVASGCAVLLVDSRGHGDSRGTAMDFGWFGDLDIAAGTEFLASRTDVDPDRIGVVGFSMGGEEAIGAAATDPRIRAVVAEGATGRQAADKEWLSDAYGWRGWIQERLEHLQDGVTDYLTDASPPIPLRSAVIDAPNTRFLLITAGNVPDEGRAASYIRHAARGRVTVWTVPGADHIGGFSTQPVSWRQHVVEFLDEALR